MILQHIFGKRSIRAVGWVLVLCLLFTGCSSRLLTDPEVTGKPSSPAESGGLTESDGAEDTPTEPFYLDPMDSSLPCVFIDTQDQVPITSTSRYLEATLSIEGAEYVHYNITTTIQIRGRGHSSFESKADLNHYDSKNSYRIKLTEKVNLLGVGETADRDWILVSGKYDVSALRNYLIWDLANRMDTIPYVPSCTWVNLYLNGDFRGMYTLVEKVEVASDRVNIEATDSTDPATVGYLVEYDLRGAYKSGATLGLTYFYIPGLDDTFAWVVQSEPHSTRVTSAIREHLILCNQAILSGDRDRMEQHVDMDSFVDMFIIQELSKNPDAGCSSFFMQRDEGGKLCLTAPWDFDFSMGAYSVSNTTSGLVADGEGVMSHPWFEFLVTQPWFMELVLARMEEISPLLEQTLAEVAATAPLLEEAADMNHRRWNLYGVKFSIYPSDKVSVLRDSYRDHVDFLLDWVETRWGKLEREVRSLT